MTDQMFRDLVAVILIGYPGSDAKKAYFNGKCEGFNEAPTKDCDCLDNHPAHYCQYTDSQSPALGTKEVDVEKLAQLLFVKHKYPNPDPLKHWTWSMISEEEKNDFRLTAKAISAFLRGSNEIS